MVAHNAATVFIALSWTVDGLNILKGDPIEQQCTQQVWWLHAPKCGSSFAATLHGCPVSVTRDTVQRHQILQETDEPSEVVGLFREPSQRLASGYAWMSLDLEKRAPGSDEPLCCGTDWGWSREEVLQVRGLLGEGVEPGESDYLQSFHGCQTNMILGRGCMSRYHNTAEDVKKAKALVDKFFFVGLESEWGLSVCLFNYLTRGQRFVDPIQIGNMMPTRGLTSTKYDTHKYIDDLADEALYAHIKERFSNDLAKYEITKQSCALTKSGEHMEIPDVTLTAEDEIYELGR